MKKRNRWMPLLLAPALFLTAWSLSGCKVVNEAAIRLGMRDNPYVVSASVTGSGFEEYRYSLLEGSMAEMYREMVSRIENNEDSANVYAQVTSDEFWEVMDAVMADHPEFFWLTGQNQVMESGLSGKVVSYELGVSVGADERASVRSALEAEADRCIAMVPDGASEYEAIKTVYEYLIENTDYELGSPDNQNIQSALINHRSVCAGYARSFEYILHRMGMFCIYVTGSIRDRGDHAWNIVSIDNQYYNVDVTWGDPQFTDESTSHPAAMNYYYLCCTDAVLERTHQPEGGIMLPACTDDSYNYYKLNGMYYDYYDPDTIYRVMMDSVYQGEESLTMVFGSQEAYQAALYGIFEENLIDDAAQYLMQMQGTSSYRYYYYPDEDFNMISIVW